MPPAAPRAPGWTRPAHRPAAARARGQRRGHPVPAGQPPTLKARLFAAFGLEILWNKPDQQVTVFVEITENTLQAIPGITDPSQDGYHDTDNTGTQRDQPEPMWDLGNIPGVCTLPQP